MSGAYPRTMRSHKFQAANLYSHKERGETLCGADVGTEATYTPTLWYDLGPCMSFPLGDVVLKCENPRCTGRP